jgi:hypothetical protein
MKEPQTPVPGEDINDPNANPADVADDRARREESREEQRLTGGKHDDAGHTPKVPDAE